MNNIGNNAFGIKFESDDSTSSMMGTSVAGGNASVPPMRPGGAAVSNYVAAEAAVAKLGSIMEGQRGVSAAMASLKRKPDSPPSADMDADDKKKKPLTNERREERNMREKERSLKITQQIHELRNLLSLGGVIVPKGTKSTILTEAANYIRLLQQQQYRSEMDKAQLVQEVQRIGNGAIGEKAAFAIRHAAAQNGVSTIANLPDGPVPSAEPQQTASSSEMSDTLCDREYRCVFNSCSVGMAIATMGGSFIDCNLAFTELSSYTKQELKAMTIFNVTSREDLQGAFDMMSHLITPPTGGLDADGNNIEDSSILQSPVILRSAIRHRSDLGLSVSLIRGEDGVARYFNVTLVKLPPSPMGLGGLKPVPATAEMSPPEVPAQRLNVIQQTQQQTTMPMAQTQPEGMNKQNYPGLNAPQYTAG
mmetsp:Transcript_4075/g.7791  ORF Transcript_4075/g.7791 Transcript_4075/m.7791 type:complete len:420 (+) Transcript_4075:311-1570(+)|eukprot:CAMPEP_0196131318 /NCGR_PEP_ID=MMETSP0910-20130528/1382_1 /TAXON_ID=49265 /ORGANISM="Thalassiosira rotula, Strain GSO102" /LENGTH=419 /DNA_ID=CAMNT_0041390783 /DNA_START=262 /DNA_END=1521 /DNA_ORIENTATION=+